MFREFMLAHFLLAYELAGVFAVFIAVILVFGVLFARFDRVPLGDAIYLAFITAFTVGFGDVTPKSAGARVLTIMLAFLGLTLMGVVVAVAVHALADIAITILVLIPARNTSVTLSTSAPRQATPIGPDFTEPRKCCTLSRHRKHRWISYTQLRQSTAVAGHRTRQRYDQKQGIVHMDLDGQPILVGVYEV